jgi:deferrochelatase/peroxidase EfeB
MTMALPIADIQGLILRSYGMDALSVVVLRVNKAAEARRALGALAVTSGVPWTVKPEACLNVALTYEGLTALQLPRDSLASFPDEFVQGAVARAAEVGDIGASAPEHWKPALTQPGVHVLVLLFAQTAAIRDREQARLSAAWGGDGVLSTITVLQGDMLPGQVAHFGYRDGFSQPTIAGGLPSPIADVLPAVPAGSFVLGYQSQFRDFTYPVPVPNELGANGSFLALRLLEQNCAAFEALLAEAPAKYGISGEELAAKIVGRWRTGVPLALSPETSSPSPEIPLDQINSFDYAPTAAHPETFDDRQGYRCPIGAHMRRNNPRNAIVAGNSGLRHRLVRRGLPYGPPFDPANPDDGVERGLLGLFIGVSLKDQFEFLMSEWVNGDIFAPGLSGTKDPLLGNSAAGTGKFTIPRPGAKPIVVSGFSQFVTTRGAAYVFLPSLTALQHIARL